MIDGKSADATASAAQIRGQELTAGSCQKATAAIVSRLFTWLLALLSATA